MTRQVRPIPTVQDFHPDTIVHEDNLASTEQLLLQASAPRYRLHIITALVNYYIYTNPSRADVLLQRTRNILDIHPLSDVEHNYFHQRGLLHNQKYEFEAARSFFERALEMVREYGQLLERTNLEIDYATTLSNLGEYDAAERILHDVVRSLRQYPRADQSFRASVRSSYLLFLTHAAKDAVEALHQSRNLFQFIKTPSAKDNFFYTIVNTALGTLYQQQEDYDKAVRHFQNTINLCLATNLRSRISHHYLKLGNAFRDQGDQESAIINYEKSIHATEDLGTTSKANSMVNLGRIYTSKGRTDKAFALFNQAEHLYHQAPLDDPMNLARIESARGDAFSNGGNNHRAWSCYKKALKEARDHDDIEEQQILTESIGHILYKMGEAEHAYFFLSQSVELRDQIIKENKAQELRKQSAIYERVQHRQELEKLKIRASQLQMKALSNQMSPHFLFNAMNAVQSEITSGRVLDAGNALASLAKLMRDILQNSEKEYITLEGEIDFLRQYLNINSKLRFQELFDFNIHVDDEIEEDIIGVPPMVLQPFLENSIEHGLRPLQDIRNGHITIRFDHESDEVIICTITDNGIGREAARKHKRDASHKSMGLSITRQRLQILLPNSETRNPVVFKDLYKQNESGDLVASGTQVRILLPSKDFSVK